MIGTFLLLVQIGGVVAYPPQRFHSLADCHTAAKIIAGITDGPVEVACADARTGEKLAVAIHN